MNIFDIILIIISDWLIHLIKPYTNIGIVMNIGQIIELNNLSLKKVFDSDI